jgi:hypothetical protein
MPKRPSPRRAKRGVIGRVRRRMDDWTVRPGVLNHPNIPLPLHGLAPRIIKGATWWRQTREAAFKRTHYHCVACGVYKMNARLHKWLEGHELYQVDYLLGRSTYIETVPLCHCCHNYIHSGRMRAMVSKGKLSHQRYTVIIQHGDAVLSQAGIRKEEPYPGPFADWKDWRLVLDGVEYEPRFKTPRELEEYHDSKD